MFRKNSIFVKILIPVIFVMLFQTVLISLVLFAYGTIRSLDDSAVEAMMKNAENRNLGLMDKMAGSWSNLDKLEADIIAEIDAYLSRESLALDDALGSHEHEIRMLGNMSSPLINALRLSTATGVFIYFTGDAHPVIEATLNGLYYRDFDPVSNPADNSDILFLRGYVSTARKDRIQLDSSWNERFTFSQQNPETWRTYAAPHLAAREHPGASPSDLAYWSRPLSVNNDPSDANQCITYTRPLFYQGKLVAMIGAEVQLSYLEKYLPAYDFGSDQGGYMLVNYSRVVNSYGPELVDVDVFTVTGSYMSRLIGDRQQLQLAATNRDNIYTLAGNNGMSDAHIALQPLLLYNTNAPFSNERWAIAAIGTDQMLFEASESVKTRVLHSTVLALAVGTILLAVIIRLSTKPLISMARQIEKSGPDELIIVSQSNSYEVSLLCTTINAMKYRQHLAESQLRAERERYLIALESVADTFMEYDVPDDRLILYYFEEENDKSRLSSDAINGFIEMVDAGEVCHPNDIKSFLSFLCSKITYPIEVRIKASIFSRITGVTPDGGYYWFLLKASRITGDDGTIVKVIGTAREITAEKLEQFARIETTRRDITTGLYKHDYGMKLARDAAYTAWKDNVTFAVSVIFIVNCDEFEAYYGRVFAAVLLRKLRGVLALVMSSDDIATRMSNDEFLAFSPNISREDVEARAARCYEAISGMYTGENTELRLTIGSGTAFSTDGGSFGTLIQNAGKAARYSAKTGSDRMVFYSDLPDDVRGCAAAYRDKPVSVFIDVSKENIVGLTFELFESATDVHSAVNLLLSLIGEMFSMRHIILCGYDADFGAGQVTHQWSADGVTAHHYGIERILREDLANFEALLDENGALLYNAETIASCGKGVRQLLCASPGDEVGGYCCVIYENGVHAGRILFKQQEEGRAWMHDELHGLYEISKIIAAHLSIARSSSASRAKSEFLSRISHEIRTPMNAIIGMTEIAKHSMQDAARLGDCLDKIDFSAKHLLSLINDVLEMSRIESGKLQIESGAFSIDEFARGIDTLMRPPIEAAGISFVINNTARHSEVLGDEYRLRQVIVNLIGNANKFTGPGGEIVFTIEEPEWDEGADRVGYFGFSVKDNGVGINPEDQPNIFKAFEQADSGKHQGTGLGLAISSNIVSAMGGRIRLDSSPGEGSEFYFTIKLGLGEAQAPTLTDERQDIDYAGYFTGKKALLVEDNEINIEIAAYILEDGGLDIDVARDGQEAVDKFLASQEGYYDVILMDIQMPVMDGLTATRNIRKNTDRADARTVPIIAMTANAFDEDMKKSIQSGMNGHVAKPIDVGKLYQLIKKLMFHKGDDTL